MNRSILLRLAFISIIGFTGCIVLAQNRYETQPFSTDQTHITAWNGEQYVPFFIKGMNLGVSKPGTFPGELAASAEDYARWFRLIQEAGYNTIRLYTLHYPRFYEELLRFNTNNPNKPLYFFQGIWIEEEIPGYVQDLYQLTEFFQEELQGNVGAVHGNVTVPERQGKASGVYTADVSKYLVGFLVGREIYPGEVSKTNQIHANDTQYRGQFLSISNAKAAETWMTSLLDDVLSKEQNDYGMTHPISFSSWPTLDPLSHPEEESREEDSVTIDLRKMDLTNAPAGYFASYHAYPYYPDFISEDPDYQGVEDHVGQNSYLAYLRDLKSYYNDIPLLIAEFGTSTSWGIAHYAQNGIHHGGADELQMANDVLRMYRNTLDANTAGGIQFAWIDEWFKRTWISDPFDYDNERRVLWHNITSAEQNFGLLGYRKQGNNFGPLENICEACPIRSYTAGADYSFFRLKVDLAEAFNINDTLWVGLDTYADNLGESILPDGKAAVNRSEFCLMITQDKAELYVTQAYDSYGIWHRTSAPEQLFRSTQTDGKSWRIVRWKNNTEQNEVQFIGRVGVNRLNLPLKNSDGVIVKDRSIEIKLPWTLLHFVDPSLKKVLHDDRNTVAREDTISEGIAIDLHYKNQSFGTAERFSWENWNFPHDSEEYPKQSYFVMKEELDFIPSASIAHIDSYELDLEKLTIDATSGVLSNDVSFGLSTPEASLVSAPAFGIFQLNRDGSFTYQPVENHPGSDHFTYRVVAGPNRSLPVSVNLAIEIPLSKTHPNQDAFEVTVYPNPASDYVQFETTEEFVSVELFNTQGQVLKRINTPGKTDRFEVANLSKGIYFLRFSTTDDQKVYRVIKK